MNKIRQEYLMLMLMNGRSTFTVLMHEFPEFECEADIFKYFILLLNNPANQARYDNMKSEKILDLKFNIARRLEFDT